MDDLALIFRQLGLSLLLGLLVGLQRERAGTGLAGLRTVPLVSVLGTLAALLGQTFGGWVVAAGLLAVVGITAMGNVMRLRNTGTDLGTTTEFALAVMYAVGALVVVGPMSAAVAVGAAVAVLLQFKPQLHYLAGRLERDDLNAIMQFVLVSCVVLPVLPDKAYGPYDVLNPYHIWLMVVLIVGISLAGYVTFRFFGRRAGILLSGFLGGAISSTATTVSHARLAARQPQAAGVASLVIMISAAVVFVRVLVEVAAVAPSFLPVAAPPIAILLASACVPAVLAYAGIQREPHPSLEQRNPTEMKSAALFAGLYALVLLALAAAKEQLGGQGLYLVAGLSGLTDMDAITLSTSSLVVAGKIAPETGWRLLVIASLSNLVFKAAIVGAMGGGPLLRRVAVQFLVPVAAGIALLVLL